MNKSAVIIWLDQKASSQKEWDKQGLVRFLGKPHLPWKFKSRTHLSALLNLNSLTQLSLEFSLLEGWSLNGCAHWAFNHWTTFSDNLCTVRRRLFVVNHTEKDLWLNIKYCLSFDYRWISCSTRFFPTKKKKFLMKKNIFFLQKSCMKFPSVSLRQYSFLHVIIQLWQEVNLTKGDQSYANV